MTFNGVAGAGGSLCSDLLCQALLLFEDQGGMRAKVAPFLSPHPPPSLNIPGSGLESAEL